jgi:hypothetical protein
MKHGFSLFWPALALILLLRLDTAPSAWAQTYHGKVVDAETEEPVEGAVVVVVWYKKPLITMDGPTYFHDAKEVLTDPKGEFSLDGSPAIDWNPFTYIVKQPWIVIYKPGYGPLTRTYAIKRSLPNMEEALEKGAVVRLPKLKTREEQLDVIQLGLGVTIVPPEKIPLLRGAIDSQSRMLGFGRGNTLK